MSKKIKVAAVQMRSTYGEVGANLQKAEQLVIEAAKAGAKMIVLPELFNTGYGYTPENHELAELPDGQTYRWMMGLAARLDIHLAGSFLLCKGGHIFNTLLLAAPDGQTWEYDKLHPWGWERAYFCAGKEPKIADTALGKIGLMICYDVAFPDVFAAYAGKIQLLLVSSCPPRMNHMTITFPDGRQVGFEELNPINRATQNRGDAVFDDDLRAQSAWLGVPLVNAMPYGNFVSQVPRGKLSFASSVVINPRLWPLIRQADKARISAAYNQHTMIADANGVTLSCPPDGDSFAIAELELPNNPPQPNVPQPKMRLHSTLRWMGSLLSQLVISEYKNSMKNK